MSHPRGAASQFFPWVAVILALLAVYVGTWPMVEIKTSSVVEVTGRGSTRSWFIPQCSPWVNTLYRPLIYLRFEWNAGQNPLSRYWDWWYVKEGEPFGQRVRQ